MRNHRFVVKIPYTWQLRMNTWRSSGSLPDINLEAKKKKGETALQDRRKL